MFRFIILLCVIFSIGENVFAARVTLFQSEKNKTYESISANCIAKLKEKFPSIEVKICIMEENQPEQTLRKEILNYYPDINLAIGKPAAQFCNSLTIFPFVYTMVVNPKTSGLVNEKGLTSVNGTGINILPSPLSQFEELKKHLPNTKVVGTLYSPSSLPIFTKGKDACTKLHLTMEAAQVDNPDDVTKYFRNLAKKEINVYWLLFDMNLVNKFNLEYLIQGCQIRQINLLTFNPNHIKMGAAIAVYLDYEGLGKQLGEVALRVLNGEVVTSIPMADAKYTKTSLNEKNIFLGKNKSPLE
jgi:putative tryptophan/tyrosine transport system substrate-binding protein